MPRNLLSAAFACFLTVTASADDWPEFQGPGRQNIWRESGIIESFPKPVLDRAWSAPVGPGYSGPTVAEDKVFVLDHPDRDHERILCFDRRNGRPVWEVKYRAPYENVNYGYGPRASVTVAGGRAYALGTMGHLHCIDATSGDLIWANDLSKDYEVDMPIWGLTSSPLVEGRLVIVQAGAREDGACYVAFDKVTGKEAWRAFNDKAGYVSPMMIEQAGMRVLLAWTGSRLAGMAPDTGKVHWEIALKPKRMPINVPNPALSDDGSQLFLTTFYDGSRLVQLGQDKPTAKILWEREGVNERKTDALHSMISPPCIDGDFIYGVDSYGQLRCLEKESGDRVWEDTSATPPGRWSTIFMIQNGDRTWMLNEEGDLIIAKLTKDGFEEIDRTRLIEPTTPLKQRRSGVVLWSPPAFAHKCVFVRNDKELICVDLAAK